MIRVYYDPIKGEDLPVIGTRTYGIIDGATPVGGSKHMLLDYIRQFSRFLIKYEKVSLRESVDYALTVTDYPEYRQLKPWEKPSAAAGVVRVFDDRIETFRAADVVIIVDVDGKIYTLNDSSVEKYDKLAWDEMKKLIKGGKTYEEAYKIVSEKILRKNRELIGKEYFPIYPGGRVDMYKFKEFYYSDYVQVAIMSDGFYRFFLFTELPVEKIFEVAPESIIAELRDIEEDVIPETVDFPFFGRHDDASLVIFDRKV